MPDYHHQLRSEIAPLLPARIGRVLEVGCAAGITLQWLKQVYPGIETVGVEVNHALEDELRANADRTVFVNNGGPLPNDLGLFDVILFLDVLEHLPDPLATLRQYAALLKPDGHVIVSVPNIAHYSVALPLLFGRRFSYQDAGILDRTHLRFFVESTAIGLLNDAGFVVDAGVINGIGRKRNRLINAASFGLLRHHLVEQYIMRGNLVQGAFSQPRVTWRLSDAALGRTLGSLPT